MKRSFPTLLISVLTVFPIIGLIGLLLAEGFWELPFLVLTTLPILLGSGLFILRRKN